MASRAITYVWKIQRPAQEELAQRLMALAYQTAMAADPNATTVLVRSDVHPTTTKGGVVIKDDPHITLCSKNSIQKQENTHEASHGYTRTLTDWTLVRPSPSKFVKPDDTKDSNGKPIWPSGLKTETIVHGGG